MAKPKVGDRVGAIQSAKEGVVKIYGFGVYEGDFLPSEAVGTPIADMLVDNKLTNPKILLDNGKVVYGCECWWASEEQVRKQLETFDEVVEVCINEDRAETRARLKELAAEDEEY